MGLNYSSEPQKFASSLKENVPRRTFVKTLIGLAVISAGGELVACSTKQPEGIEFLTYKGHTDYVWAATWSPVSQNIASGGADQTIQVWDAASGMLQSKYQHHSAVTVIDWSPDGRYIASGGINGMINVWDTTSSLKKPVSQYNVGYQMWGMGWSPDGKYIAASNRNTVKIYDTNTKILKLTCYSHAGNIWNLAWSPDSRYLVSACVDNSILLFDIQNSGSNLSSFKSFKLHLGRVWGVDWSSDGRYIASGGDDHKIIVCDAGNGSTVFTGEHSDLVYGVTWSPDSKYVISAGQDGLAKVWNVSEKSNAVNYDSHSGPLFRNSWAPESKRIVTAYRDGTVQVWGLPPGF